MLLFVLFGTMTPHSDIAAQEDWDAELEFLLSEFVGDDEPGLVVWVGDEQENAMAAVGLADLDAGIPVQTNDRFRIGSSSKPFTAVLTLQLLEEGLVDLDEPISVYLPSDIAERISNADSATVRQVLNMTSGIYSYTESDAFADAVDADFTYPWTASEVLTYIFDEPADFEAGADWYYSNSNFVLLQLLVEGVTGQPLADLLEDRIFAPLDMESCYLEDPNNLAAGLMPGYAYDGEFYDISRINDGIGLGDGGIICTAADLAKFLPALANDRVMGDDTLLQMVNFVDTGDEGGYGLGISQKVVAGYELWGHEGSTSGFASDMQYMVDEDTTIVLLTNNFDSEILEDVLEIVIEWWLS